MLQLKAGSFYDISTSLAAITSSIGPSSLAFPADRELDEEDRRYLGGHLGGLRQHLAALGARITLAAVDELQRDMILTWWTWGDIKKRLEEIRNTLKRELSFVTFIVLDPKEQSYFEPQEPHFSLDVALKFLSTAEFEIDEAAKCLALRRSTAAVFHLMRVMEFGIRAAARCLQIPDPVRAADRNWGNVLRAIKTDLDGHVGPSPTKVWTVPGDKEFFESAYVSLDAVRVAWRNTTTHVEKKYTDDEAQHIFVAVRGFMIKLASRCDENGDPKA